MSEHPERLRPFSEADIARIDALTKNVTVSDEDVIPDDVTL
jgi:antitoxin PrlF